MKPTIFACAALTAGVAAFGTSGKAAEATSNGAKLQLIAETDAQRSAEIRRQMQMRSLQQRIGNQESNARAERAQERANQQQRRARERAKTR